MNIRITSGAAALVLGAALALSGCSSDGDSETAPSPSAPAETGIPEPSTEDVAALDAVTVTGDPGAEPTLEFSTPFTVSAPTSRVIDEGTGPEIAAGNQVTINFVQFMGDGTKAGSTWEQGQPESFYLGDPSYEVLNEPLTGAQVGQRLLIANPVQGAEGETATVVSLLEVTGTAPARAEGEAVEPAEGLPTVTLGDDGAPSIEIPEGYEAPAEMVVQPLIKGTGPEVTAESTVTVHYTGVMLDGTQFDSSWERGTPATFPLTGDLISGWTEGLPGQTVGSQVLLVLPADKAYGEEGSQDGSIPPNTPLVFVIDILDAQ
ncbi:peptidylprolyl isomerase [Xylanimonas oleitrophica]|uniref:Peptidyl-prolyl cis-trans isomerase n=1 Tax=Xylanimonas oleitrophica TaxID=2607479 RepID=A0A2W5WMR7_9MICO|nr:FKBP-type peptidyl-prolyl cis-trans isomerase [Xylanimonas oleitrophica]PZR52033.1 peptidylprolyl isomerase [Xylanimonas oleitrophica]